MPGTRYQLKYRRGWGSVAVYGPSKDVRSSRRLNVRVLIATVEDEARLLQVLRLVPTYYGPDRCKCKNWVTSAFAMLKEDGRVLGQSVASWENAQEFAVWYAMLKHSGGRYAARYDLSLPKPTLDLLNHRERIF